MSLEKDLFLAHTNVTVSLVFTENQLQIRVSIRV